MGVITELPEFKNDLDLAKYVRDFLVNQGVQSRFPNEGACAYRGADNTACAAGCLILDKHYSHHIEGYGCTNSEVCEAIEASIGKDYNPSLVSELQYIHDNYNPDEWEEALDGIIEWKFTADGNYAISGGHVSI